MTDDININAALQNNVKGHGFGLVSGLASFTSKIGVSVGDRIKYIPFEPLDKVHSYAIKQDMQGVSRIVTYPYKEGDNYDPLSPWDNKSSASRGADGRDIQVHSLDSKLVKDRKIYYTVTNPTEEPQQVIIYAKGNAWDLGTFHRSFKPQPYVDSVSNMIKRGIKTEKDPEIKQYYLKNQQETDFSFYLKEDRREAIINNAMFERTTKDSLAKIIADATKSTVYCFEYPGYGVERFNQINPAHAVYYMVEMIKYVAEQVNKPIILHGFSVGCAVAIRALAYIKNHDIPTYEKITGVILQSPFSVYNDVAGDSSTEVTVLNGLKGKIYDTYKYIDKVEKPVAIMHGYNDITCPIYRSYQKLYKDKQNVFAFKIFFDADHNTIPLFRSHYNNVMQNLVENMNKPLSNGTPNSQTRETDIDDTDISKELSKNLDNNSLLEMFASHKTFFMYDGDPQERDSIIQMYNRYVLQKQDVLQKQGGSHKTKKYTKTTKTYTGRDKIQRIVYVNQKGKQFIKKKSKATNKFQYYAIRTHTNK